MVPASSIPPPLPSASQPSKPAPKTNWRLVLLVVFPILLLLVLGTVGGWYAVSFIKRELVGEPPSPEDQALLKQLETKPVKLVPAVYQVEPLPQSLVERREALESLWKEVEHDPSLTRLLQKITHNAGPSAVPGAPPPDWDAVLAVHDELSTESANLLPLYLDLIRDPDYREEVFLIGAGYPSIQDAGLETALRKLLRAEFVKLEQEGRCVEALELGTDLLVSAKIHPYAPIIAQLFVMSHVGTAIRSMNEVLPRIEDTAALRMSLDRINSYSGSTVEFIQKEMPLEVSDALGSVVVAEFGGMDVSLQGGTGFDIISECRYVEAQYLEQVILPTVGDDQARREAVQGGIEAANSFASMFHVSNRNDFSTIRIRNIVAISFSPDETYPRETACLTKLDLLRIQIARRIHFLEHGSNTASWESLVPQHFPVPFPDRFRASRESLSISTEGVFYSFGPDGDDDRTNIPYGDDLGDGDIFLGAN